MTDARILTTLPSHPKTKRLIRRLGGDGAWRLVCLFLWARGNRPDGDLTGLTDEDIELATDWNGTPGALIAALIECGFIDGAEGSRTIHDWAQHQPWSLGSSRRSEAAKSNAAKKWGIELAATNSAKRSDRLAAARRIATHTQEEWTALLSALGGRCLVCGAESDICKDHINPLYLGGSDGIDNLQPLCRSCNSKKCGPGREIDYRPADWAERLRIALISGGMLAERLPNACKTPADSEKTPAPSPAPSPSPSPLPSQELEAIVSADAPTNDNQPAEPSADELQAKRAAKAERLSVITREAVAAYNAELSREGGGALSIVTLPDSDVRRNNVRRCLKTAKMIADALEVPIDADFWTNYFAECAKDDFHAGRGPYTGTHANWRPDFEYLTRPDVMTKIFDKARG